MNPFSEFLQRIMAFGLELYGLFYGTYRGVVIDNDDPDNLGRIKVHVPQIHGDDYPDVWAWPKALWAGNKCGLFMLPDKGQTVYVSFDHGRAECPIWEGGWWGTGELHADMKQKQILLITPEGLRFQVDRENMRITLSSGDKKVTLDDDQIYLKHPVKVFVEAPNMELKGDTLVDGPLTVTEDVKLQAKLEVTDNVDMKKELKVATEATIGPLGIKFTTHKHPTAGTGDPSVPIP